METKPFVLQINAGVGDGGAARIAVDIYRELNKYNFNSKIATGGVIPPGKDYLKIERKTFSDAKNLWESLFFSICKRSSPFIGKIKGAGRLTNLFYNIGRPSYFIKQIRGVENFENYPGTREFFKSLIPFPDLIHCHNLHGDFFDLSILSDISKKVPVVITLHDEWMLTGHCAISFGCTRWKIGCGKCPYLNTYPKLWRDTTKYNIQQKRSIYRNSNLHIVTPSKWLMNEVKESVLAEGIASSHVIHNGVDLSIFKPKDKGTIRKEKNLPTDAYIILYAANNAKTNEFKDYPSLEKAFFLLAEQNQLNKKLIVFCVGEASETIIKNNCELRFIKYLNGCNELASYYQAADIFVHATKADNFPTTVLEALGCGLPVIGTRIGGVVEQIYDYKISTDQATGTFYALQNHNELADEIFHLLTHPELRAIMSKNARIDAEKRFDLNDQMNHYVTLYDTLLHSQDIPNAHILRF